jgi:diacylglycerol kinase family enzyme
MGPSKTAGAVASPQSSARPGLRRIAAVVNSAAGGVGPGASDVLAKLIADYGYDLSLSSPEPNEIEAAVKSAIDSAPDLVLILAGDGTAGLAAELSGPDGPLIAPLPGGTLNMLPHALYGTRPWPAAVAAALDSGVERTVCGGKLGGRTFYVAAIVGAPALWGHAREAVRARDFIAAGRRASYALRRAFGGGIRYSLDGRESRKAEALILISPLVSTAMARDEPALEAAALDVHDAREAFRLAFNGLVSDWRVDPSVTVEACGRGWIQARHAIPCILDGETHRMPGKVDFEFLPHAFRALAPPPQGDA